MELRPTNRIKEFLDELKKHYPKVVVTSNYRSKAKHRHKNGDALDLKVDKGLYDFLTSSKGIALMHKYSLGMLHEVHFKNYKHESDTHWLEGDKELVINGKKKGGTGGTGEHYHIGPDIFVNNGGSPLAKNGRFKNNIQQANLNNVGRIYTPSKGEENRRLSTPLYDKSFTGNGKTNNNTNMNGEEIFIKHTGMRLNPYKSKSQIKQANDLFEKAYNKLDSNEEKNALIGYFRDNGYIDGKGYGPMIKYREEKFDEEFKGFNEQMKELNLAFDLISKASGQKLVVNQENGDIERISTNTRTAEKIKKITGVEAKKTGKKILGSGGIWHDEYLYEGDTLKKMKQSINNKIYYHTGKESDYFKDGVYKNDNGDLSFQGISYDVKTKDRVKIYYTDPNNVSYDNGSSEETSGTTDYQGIAGGYSVDGIETPITDYESFIVNFPKIAKTIPGIETWVKPPTKEQFEAYFAGKAKMDNDMIKKYIQEIAEKQKKINDDELEQAKYRSESGLEQLRKETESVFEYDKSEYSKLEGVDKLLQGGLMGLIGIKTGQDLAKTPLQMRDETIGETYMDYVSEMKKLSEIGLRPEEEAYAKRMLSESYQAGLDNIVRASGGNRNAVLGNLGRLDYQKQVGLMNLAMEDAKAKKEAMNKYGEAAKYISEFENTKDIANNERLYQESQLKRQTGSSLAQKGFESLINSINEYRDNAPGSANHMQKAFNMEKMFGYNPNSPKSVEAYKEKMSKLKSQYENSRKILEHYDSLTYEQKVSLNDYMKKSGILSVYDSRLLPYYERNTGYKVERPSVQDILFGNGNGIKTNDYSINKGQFGGSDSSSMLYDDNEVKESSIENSNNGRSNISMFGEQNGNKEYNPFNSSVEINMPDYLKGTEYLFPKSANLNATKEGFEYGNKDKPLSLLEQSNNQRKENQKIINYANDFLIGSEKRVKKILEEEENIKQQNFSLY